MSGRGEDYRVNPAANDTNAKEHESNPEPTKDQASEINPKTTHYEFFGPIGAFGVTVGTPVTTYFLYYFLIRPSSLTPIITWNATLIYFNWFTALVFLWWLIPVKAVHGPQLRTGGSLEYRMNGFQSLLLVLSVVCAGVLYDRDFLEPLVVEFLPLITASTVASYVLAAWSYYVSLDKKELLAEGGNSGNFVYDFFIGRALNPRIGSFDVKVFCELRPGLFLWLLLNLAFLIRQYLSFGYVTDSMLLVVGFQAWYVTDSVWNESAVLSTMDVTTDGFGFMLAFGDLTWVPFTYSLQARYLSVHPVQLGYYSFVILAIQFTGYYIFRSANNQKDLFRSQPDHPAVKNLKFIQTDRGTKLLADGWWGTARHTNYLGDWIMAWAWCLPTGFGNPLTYFYAIYFAILLIHRERRDEEKCSKKYGKSWVEYKKAVNWRIVPYLY